jgi:hypothetical protein
MPTSRRTPQKSPPPSSRPPQNEPTLLIDPRWILKALVAVMAVALVLSYATLCLLFYQGQWQLVLHPSRTVAATPASFGLTFSDVHLFPAASGEPQLDGWLIPAANTSAPTALLLHGADGSIADALPSARTLHDAGLNVLLFDYRGFGRSAGRHPDQASMQEDAAAALTFLTATQHIAPSHIILFGSGLGASLAVRLAAEHRDIPALILESPDGDFAERARTDPRSRLVPTRWLFSQTFPLADPLHTLATPKLLIAYTTGAPPLIFQRAADPKLTLELPNRTDPALLTAIHRFLDLYLRSAPNP